MKIHIILAVLCIQAVFAGTPTEALTAFEKTAQSKDFETTWNHAAKFKGISDNMTELLKASVKEFIAATALPGSHFEIIDEKIDGDCAVCIINSNEKKGHFDIYPMLLIKQDDEWMVSPAVSRWDIAKILAKDKVDNYTKLHEWFNSRKRLTSRDIQRR